MSVTFRHYTNIPGFTDDFHRVRNFLSRINREKVITPNFLWGRWEWAFSLPFLDIHSLSKIGIWEDNGDIAAIAAYEQDLGSAYFCIDERYGFLKREMLIYAKENLHKEGEFKALISDTDRDFQLIALEEGFKPTQNKEPNSVFKIDTGKMDYVLPEGYTVTSLSENMDINKYNRVLWRGFNHEGEPPETKEDIDDRWKSLSGPNINLDLNIAVVSPEGEYVSYCGMWYEKGAKYALVEPVATDPAYRMKGLGKAAVLEAIKRCGKLGAQEAYVGSSQQFYYQIGFSPLQNETFWECR